MNDLEAAIAAIWDRSRPVMQERLDHIDAAAAGLRDGALGQEAREEGSRAAHQLAGSLGSFGMPDGSDVARAIEDQLRADRPPPEPDPAAVADLVARLHQIMDPRLG